MNRVKKYREAAGLSQSELARRAGLPRNTIYNIEKKGSKLQTMTAKVISKALNVPVKVLICAADEEWQDADYLPHAEGEYLVAFKPEGSYYCYTYEVVLYRRKRWWAMTDKGTIAAPFEHTVLWWADIPKPPI